MSARTIHAGSPGSGDRRWRRSRNYSGMPRGFTTRLTDEIIGPGPEVAGGAEFKSAVKQRAVGGTSLALAPDLVEWIISPRGVGISRKTLGAPWDAWKRLREHAGDRSQSDVYTLSRIAPGDRFRSLELVRNRHRGLRPLELRFGERRGRPFSVFRKPSGL